MDKKITANAKFVLTLIDNKTRRSVRVSTRNEVIKRNQESEFIQYSKVGRASIDNRR